LLLPILTACERAKRGAGLQSGMALPSVELPILDGGRYLFAEKSAPCLINFWATWCLPCRAEMASLNRLCKDYAGRGLGVFAVSVDEDAHLVREFIRQARLDFLILLDPGGKVTEPGFGVSAFPTSFLVDRQARVGGVWVGERNWDAADIRTTLEQLILS
jgi:peroxiredoxin